MQSKTIFGDEVVLGAMAFGKQMGISADQIEEAGRAAVGLAAKYNIDLSTAMGLIAKANLGNTTALKRYGVILDESMSKEEKFAALLKIGGDSFGLAEAKTKTYAGSLAQLKNSFGEVQESIGKTVIDGLGLVSMFKSVADSCMGVSQYIGGLDDATKNAIARTGLFVMGVAALTGAYKALMMTGLVQGIAGLAKYAFTCATTTAASTINTAALWKEVTAQNALNLSRAAGLKSAGMGAMGAGIQTIGRVSGTGVVTLASETAIAAKSTLGLGAALKTMGALSFATSSAMAFLGSTAAVAGTAIGGWMVGDWISQVTGLKSALTDFYAKWIFGIEEVQKKSDAWDEKRRNMPALGAGGLAKADEENSKKDSEEETRRKYAEDMQKPTKFDPKAALEERKLQDQINIGNMANKTVEDKLKIIAYERNAILRESSNIINSTGDAEKDKIAEQERLRKLREDDIKLQIKKSDLLKEDAEKTKTAKETFEKTGRDMAFEAMTREKKINALYGEREQLAKDLQDGKYTGEDKYKKMEDLANIENDRQKLISEKNKDPLRTESSVVSAVQKGSSEALKIENTRTQRDNKIADNTLRTAKGVEKIIEAVKNIGNGGGIGFTVETAV